MSSPTHPKSLALRPALTDAVQAVLLPGESLEDFILAAVQKEVTVRAKRHQFLQSAIASSQRAEQGGPSRDGGKCSGSSRRRAS